MGLRKTCGRKKKKTWFEVVLEKSRWEDRRRCKEILLITLEEVSNSLLNLHKNNEIPCQQRSLVRLDHEKKELLHFYIDPCLPVSWKSCYTSIQPLNARLWTHWNQFISPHVCSGDWPSCGRGRSRPQVTAWLTTMVRYYISPLPAMHMQNPHSVYACTFSVLSQKKSMLNLFNVMLATDLKIED